MSQPDSPRIGPAGRMAAPLDAVDHEILRELSADGRMSIRELAGRVNVSRANAYNRLERLKSSGVLRRFTIDVDPVRSGLGTSAYIEMTVRQNSFRNMAEHLSKIPEVKHMALVGGGEFDVMLLVRATDNEHLRRVVLNQLQDLPGVLGTRTILIFEDVDNR